MTNLTRRNPNPNNYDISKVIAHKMDLAEQKKKLRNDKTVAKQKRRAKEKQDAKDRIFLILERHKINKLEAY